MSRLYVFQEAARRYELVCESCGHATNIQLAPNDTKSALKVNALKWRPRFCPNCSSRILKEHPEVVTA